MNAFDKIIGYETIKTELLQICDMIHNRKIYDDLGAKLPQGILLYGNESQTVGPLEAPMEVHLIMLGAEVVLLEGIRLSEVPAGKYLLNTAPINLGGADGAPCRPVLLEL